MNALWCLGTLLCLIAVIYTQYSYYSWWSITICLLCVGFSISTPSVPIFDLLLKNNNNNNNNNNNIQYYSVYSWFNAALSTVHLLPRLRPVSYQYTPQLPGEHTTRVQVLTVYIVSASCHLSCTQYGWVNQSPMTTQRWGGGGRVSGGPGY